MIDQPIPPRSNEKPDSVKLLSWLKQTLGWKASDIEIWQFPGGYSNLTFLVQSPQDGSCVLRRPPVGAYIPSAHDMLREYKVLEALYPNFHKVPKPLAACEDPEILGTPFYVMEKVDGLILRNRWPKGKLWTEAHSTHFARETIQALAELHRLPLSDPGLGAFGKPEGYVTRQVNGWISRYEKAATDHWADMQFLMEYLPSAIPDDAHNMAFIHNDFKYDNIVWSLDEPHRILAILDWEMATVGDPWMDVGTTLGYWAEQADPPALRAFGLTAEAGSPGRETLLSWYLQSSGRTMPDIVFYYAFASFKIAVIAQQIYARFKKGLTQDPRFAGLAEVVKACASNGKQAVQLHRIHDLYR